MLVPAIDHLIVMGSHVGDRVWNAAMNCIDALTSDIAESKFQNFHAWITAIVEQFTGLGINIAQVFRNNRQVTQGFLDSSE